MNSFNLKIKALGGIQNATIQIRPFTLITGLNSSGKSFVTKSLYSVLNVLTKDSIPQLLNELLDEFFIFSYLFELDDDEQKQFLQDIDFLKGVFADGHLSENFNKIDLKKKLNAVKERINKLIKKINSGTSRSRLGRIDSFYFSLEKVSQLIEQPEKTELELIENRLREAFCQNFQSSALDKLINRESNAQKAQLKFESITEKLLCNIDIRNNNSVAYDIKNDFIEQCQSYSQMIYLESPAHLKLAKFLWTSGFMRAKNELIGVPSYVYDLLGLIRKKILRKTKPVLSKKELSSFLSAINGKLNITETLDIVYQDNNDNLFSLEQTAMGIVNLGTILLLLENGVITQGSFLIVDEPETNLHPEWQALVVQLLYLLSQKGINVVIATHSNTIIRNIQNLIEKSEQSNNEYWGINHLENGRSLLLEKGNKEKISFILKELNKPYMSAVLDWND